MASQQKRHPVLRALVILVLAALSMPVLQSAASGAVVAGFESDGNQVSQGNLDWQTVGGVDVIRDPVGNSDGSVFAGGDSEADNDGVGSESPWDLGAAGTASGRSDIGNILVADFEAPGGDIHAAFAWDRGGDTGTGRYYLELNQSPPAGIMPSRTNGDVRIVVAMNGADLLQCVTIQTWSGQWGNAQSCDSARFEIAVNDATITDFFGSPNAPLEKNTFIEGVLNLSAFGVATCPVQGFRSIHLRSQEGGEKGDTSRLKDFGTGPISIDSDCGSLTVVKNVIGGSGSGAGAVFEITPNPTAGQPPAPGLVVTTGPDGTVTVPAAEPGDYTVRELAPPAGYLLPAVDAKPVTVPPGDPGVVEFDDVLGGVRFTKSYQGDDPVRSGATFTLTRTRAWSYDSDPAGGFDAPTLKGIPDESREVTDNGTGDADPDMGQLQVTDLRGGEYTLVEKSAPAGWRPSSDNAPAGFVIGPSDAEGERSSDLDPSGPDATFHNLLRPIAVKVVKTESVPGVPDDTQRLSGVTFRLYEADDVAGFGPGDSLVGSRVTDRDGEALWTDLDWQKDYWLQEVKKAGYEIGLRPNPQLVDIDRVHPPTTDDTVIEVAVDNPREEVTVELNKTDGTSGAPLDGGAFDLYRESNGVEGLQTGSDTRLTTTSHALVNGRTTFDRSDYQLPWGYTYYLFEATAPDGYGLMTPNPIVVRPTEADANTTVTLNATDPRLPIRLTLVKVVDNGATDGTATVADFPLSAQGPTAVTDVISGQPEATGVLVDPGTYTLSESNPHQREGYAASDWSCVGNDDTGSDGRLTLDLGDDVTCTITNTASAGTYVVGKAADPKSGSTVQRGDLVTYTITATRTGGVHSTDVLVVDDLAGVLDHADLEGPLTTSTGTAVLDGDRIEWTIPVLSGTETLTYAVRVQTQDDDNGVTLRNHVISDGSSNCPPNPVAESDDCTTEHHTPHYTLEKSSNPASGSTVDAGTDVVYTLTVTNDSDAVLAGAVVTDDLSDVVDDAGDPTGIGASATYNPVTRSLSWNVPTLQPGESTTLGYTVRIDEEAWGVTLGNVATPDAVGDCAAACSTWHATPHWTLAKTSDPASGATVDAGSQIAYTLTVHNDSGAVLAGATVTDDLSGVLDDASVVEPLDSSLGLVGTTLTWSVPTLAPGESASVSYTVLLDEDAWGATLTNLATPGQRSGECAVRCSTEHLTPRWELTKTGSPATGSTVDAGTDLQYTLTVHNDSPATVEEVSVTDDLSDVLDDASIDEESLPAGLTLDDDDPLNPSLSWSVPTLAPGATASVTYTVHIDDDAWGVTLRNLATPDQPSGACVDAGACSTEHVTPHYTVHKSSTPGTGGIVQPGDEITYRLSVHNDSAAVVDAATVSDDLSDVLDNGTITQPLDAGLALDGTTLTWTAPGPLAPGATVWVEYTVTVDADQWDVLLHNVATPGDERGDCTQPTACETTHTTPAVTTLVVKKVDLELLEDKPLPGATFALWQDNPPLSGTSPAAVGAEDTPISAAVSDADGLAKFAGLRPGHYLVEETNPPPGYGLLKVHTIAVAVVDGPDGNFVAGGEMAPILFRDPAQGQITLLPKRQLELVDGDWVESDGVVNHGDQVKYELDLVVTGPKRFHNVTLSDYVPGFNPADTTSTAKATLVPGTARCVGDLECTVSVEDGLVTWQAGTLTDAIGTAEMVVRFPRLPRPVPFDGSDEFTTTIWNMGYLAWDEVLTDSVNPVPDARGDLSTARRQLSTNEVVLRATVSTEVLPVEDHDPLGEGVHGAGADEAGVDGAVLPNTGSSQLAQVLGLLGALAVMAGGALVVAGRRRPRTAVPPTT